MAPLVKATIQLLMSVISTNVPAHIETTQQPICYESHAHLSTASAGNGPSLSAISCEYFQRRDCLSVWNNMSKMSSNKPVRLLATFTYWYLDIWQGATIAWTFMATMLTLEMLVISGGMAINGYELHCLEILARD